MHFCRKGSQTITSNSTQSLKWNFRNKNKQQFRVDWQTLYNINERTSLFLDTINDLLERDEY